MKLGKFSAWASLAGLCLLLCACAGTRQIAVDPPEFQPQSFKPVSGFNAIDGDDYYVRLISEFEYQGDNVIKSGCQEHAPSYKSGALSAALIYSIRNEGLHFKNEAPGFLYQASAGKCNFTFDAKKLYLTPWFRLDTGKETMVDYNFYTNANSDLDVSALVGDVNAASGLLALSGVGMGVALMGQVAGQWIANSPQAVAQPKPLAAKHSSETHSLPSLAGYGGQAGILKQAVFNVYDVVESGVDIFGADIHQIGALKIYPEIQPALLLKTSSDGVPDARDLSMDEIIQSPIRSAGGDINLQQLIEQSKHPAKPNLHPDWRNYSEVESSCRNLKRLMKELGFNKFDRNAMLYYLLGNSADWKNYNIGRQRMIADQLRPKILKEYRNRDFGNCLTQGDFVVMKAMGLAVNSSEDWDQMGQTSEQQEQWFNPLKSIERQLLAVLYGKNVGEMERQLYPLLSSLKGGDGTVLLQNHLGEFGLEASLDETSTAVAAKPEVAAPLPASSQAVLVDQGAAPTPTSIQSPTVDSSQVQATKLSESKTESPSGSMPQVIPGEGTIVSARQLARVIAGLAIGELSCSRPLPGRTGKDIGNIGLLLFTTREGSPRAKGGAIEYEFAGGKISRLAFQLPTFRDFEQDIMDRPEVGGCRIDGAFLSKLH